VLVLSENRDGLGGWGTGRQPFDTTVIAFRVRCFQPLSHLSAPGARERCLALQGKRSDIEVI
jgi:hypothetical protein